MWKTKNKKRNFKICALSNRQKCPMNKKIHNKKKMIRANKNIKIIMSNKIMR